MNLNMNNQNIIFEDSLMNNDNSLEDKENISSKSNQIKNMSIESNSKELENKNINFAKNVLNKNKIQSKLDNNHQKMNTHMLKKRIRNNIIVKKKEKNEKVYKRTFSNLVKHANLANEIKLIKIKEQLKGKYSFDKKSNHNKQNNINKVCLNQNNTSRNNSKSIRKKYAFTPINRNIKNNKLRRTEPSDKKNISISNYAEKGKNRFSFNKNIVQNDSNNSNNSNNNKTRSDYISSINSGSNKTIKSSNKFSLSEHNSFKNLVPKEQNQESKSEILKIQLINKINRNIENMIKSRKSEYLNQYNNITFLGFCDLLFDLGFLHIKQTKIKDISKIETHMNDLYIQPFTNKNSLTENFLYDEQKLLICSWKTILNNYKLIKKIITLPNESQEISINDFKLFIFIIKGLFIGFNANNIIRKNGNFSKTRLIKNDIKGNRFTSLSSNHSYSRESNKIHHRFNQSPKMNNILKEIIKNRKNSEYNYKDIYEIYRHFRYFIDVNKSYNLYLKNLKENNKNDNSTNSQSNISNDNTLLKKYSPFINFLIRNEISKVRIEKKMKKLKQERVNYLMKECTFEPDKKNKRTKKINSVEISNRLYYNNSYRKKNSPKNSNNNSNMKNDSNTNYNNCHNLFYDIKKDIRKSNNCSFSRLSNGNISQNIKYDTHKYNPKLHHSPVISNKLINKRMNNIREIDLKKDFEKHHRRSSDNSHIEKNILKKIRNENSNIGLNGLLFIVEIKIKGEVKRIKIYKSSNCEKIAYDFCIKNNLGTKSYDKIIRSINDKLSQLKI